MYRLHVYFHVVGSSGFVIALLTLLLMLSHMVHKFSFHTTLKVTKLTKQCPTLIMKPFDVLVKIFLGFCQKSTLVTKVSCAKMLILDVNFQPIFSYSSPITLITAISDPLMH